MIDLLRGVFSILVVFAHAAPMFGYGTAANRSPSGFAQFMLANAGFWVSGFFVLSGFCIHLSIRNSVQRGKVEWPLYFIARFTRIYPLAMIGLLAAVGVWLWIPHPGQPFPWLGTVATVLMIQNLVGGFPLFGQAWSLTNEVIYYVAWPVFLRLNNLNTSRALKMAAVSALTLAGVIVIIWKTAGGDRKDHWLIPIWSTLASSLLWLAGAALLHYWSFIAPRATWRKCLWLLPMSSLACLAFYVASYCGARAWLLHLATYAAIPFFVLLILSGRHFSFLDSRLAVRISSLLGLVSYPVYILHNQVLMFFWHWNWRTAFTPGLPDSVSYILLVFTVIALCSLGGGWLEAVTLSKRALLLTRLRNSRNGKIRTGA